MPRSLYAYVIAGVLLLVGLNNASAQTYIGPQEEIEQILKASEAFSGFYMKGDFEALANAYTEDGAILPPGADIIRGREAIKERWILPEGVTILHHKSTPTEITIKDDIAYDLGYYEGTTRRKDGTEVSWKGKYLIVWKKVDGEWLMHMDAWNRMNEEG